MAVMASDLPALLIVDDDPAIRELVRRYFQAQDFVVHEAGDAASARAVIAREAIALVLLDLGLPGEDGLALARHLRERWQGAVIIVSGRGDAVDRVVGLEVGADDYVAKPFDLRELLARVRSVLRRVQPAAAAPADTLCFAGFRLEPGARRLLDPHGNEVVLTTGEFELLQAFAGQPQRVLSRDALMQSIHGRDAGPYDRAIDVQVSRLRQKIETDAANPALIRSVRGVGYLFSASVTRA
jgi:two-component system, OmpR family, response regulator